MIENDIVDINKQVEVANTSLKNIEVKAKENLIQNLRESCEEHNEALNGLVNIIKNVTRERAKLERVVKGKMECLKLP